MATPAEEHRQTGRSAGQRGIQSIEVGGTLLQALARHGMSMTLKDLAAGAGMPPAKAHPYLVSFGKLGLIEQDPLTGRYRLGPFALQLGLSALHAVDPVRIAIRQAALLADEIGQSVAIAVWGNRGPTIIHIEDGNRPIHVNMRPGTVMTPLLLSATGRIFAALMPERVISPLLRQEAEGMSVIRDLPADGAARRAPTRRAGAPTQKKQVEALLAEIRQQRMARAIGHPIPGINALSAPVRHATGQLALAITVMGMADTFDTAWDGPLARCLRHCVQQVEHRLGRVDDGDDPARDLLSMPG